MPASSVLTNYELRQGKGLGKRRKLCQGCGGRVRIERALVLWLLRWPWADWHREVDKAKALGGNTTSIWNWKMTLLGPGYRTIIWISLAYLEPKEQPISYTQIPVYIISSWIEIKWSLSFLKVSDKQCILTPWVISDVHLKWALMNSELFQKGHSAGGHHFSLSICSSSGSEQEKK